MPPEIPSATGLGISIGATSLVQGFTYGFGTLDQGDEHVVEGFIQNNNSLTDTFKIIRNFNIGGDITFFNSFITNAGSYNLYGRSTVGFSFGVSTIDRGSKEINIFMDSNDGTTNPFLTDIFYFVQGPEIDLFLVSLDGGSTLSVPDGSDIITENGTSGIDLTQNFIIRNSGETPLGISSVTLSGASASLTDDPSGVVVTSGSTTGMAILIDGSSFGTQEIEVGISSNDSDENPYNFTINQFLTPTSEIVVRVTNGASVATVTNGSTVAWFDYVRWTNLDTIQVDIFNIGSTNLFLTSSAVSGTYSGLQSFPVDGQIVYPSFGDIDELLKYSFTIKQNLLPTKEQDINFSFTNSGFTNGLFEFGITSLVTSGIISVAIATNGIDFIPVTAGDIEIVANNPQGTDQFVEVLLENTGNVDLVVSDFVVTLDVSEIIFAPTSATIIPNGSATLGFYIDGSSLGLATAAVGIVSDYAALAVFPFGVVHNVDTQQPNMTVYYGMTEAIAGGTIATPNVYLTNYEQIDIVIHNEEPSYADLNLTNVTVDGQYGTTVAIPNGGISVGGMTTLSYTIDAATIGTKVQTINIQSDDPVDPSFTFYTTQNVLTLPLPDIRVEYLSNGEYIDITDGSDLGISGNTINEDTTFFFRVTNINDDVSLTITGISDGGNTGGDTPGISDGFLRAGESQFVSVTVDNSVLGERVASVTIISDDPDESTFLINLNTFVSREQTPTGVSITSSDTRISTSFLSPGAYIKEEDYYI